jgi:hypothetical protein
MGTTLNGTTPQDTYDSLIKVTDNGPLSGTGKYLSDGLGNDSALALSTTAVGIGTDAPSATTHVKGSGTTSATTALLVENSAGTELLKTFDNGFVTLGGASIYNNYLLDLKGANTTLRLQSNQNFNNVYCGIAFTNSTNGNSLSSEIRGYRQSYGNEIRMVVGAMDILSIQSTGQIGILTTTPHASSVLDITSTTKGFLPPRMTTVEKNAIATPAEGLVVYDTTLAKLCVYTTAWETITSL